MMMQIVTVNSSSHGPLAELLEAEQPALNWRQQLMKAQQQLLQPDNQQSDTNRQSQPDTQHQMECASDRLQQSQPALSA